MDYSDWARVRREKKEGRRKTRLVLRFPAWPPKPRRRWVTGLRFPPLSYPSLTPEKTFPRRSSPPSSATTVGPRGQRAACRRYRVIRLLWRSRFSICSEINVGGGMWKLIYCSVLVFGILVAGSHVEGQKELPRTHPKYKTAKGVFDRLVRSIGDGRTKPRFFVRPSDVPGRMRVAWFDPKKNASGWRKTHTTCASRSGRIRSTRCHS